MTRRKRELQEDVRFRVLSLLQKNPEMSQRNLAETVGIGLGSVNYCLKALIDKGLIKLGNFSASDDKRRYAYILTPKGLSERAVLTSRFLQRKMAEYETLKAEIESLKNELEQRNDL